MVITPKLYQKTRIPYCGGRASVDVEIIAFGGGVYDAKIKKVEPLHAGDFIPISITPTKGRLGYSAYTITAQFNPAESVKDTHMGSFSVYIGMTVYYEILGRTYKTTFRTVGYDAPWEYHLEVDGTPNGNYPDRVFLKDGGLFMLNAKSYRTYQNFVEYVKLEEASSESGLSFHAPSYGYGIPSEDTPYDLTVQVPKNWRVPDSAKREKAENGFTKVTVPVQLVQTESFSDRFNPVLDEGKALSQKVYVTFYVHEGSVHDEGNGEA